MSNTKTEVQQLADELRSHVQTYPQMSEDEPGGYCSQDDQLMDEAATELLSLDAQNKAIHKIIDQLRAQVDQMQGGEPVTLTDSYAGVIAWIGDTQCKLLVTEDAIKHEHTPGVVMRNAAHQCVQEVTAALREKEARK